MNVSGHIRKETRRQLWKIIFGFVFVIISSAFSLLPPLITRAVIDDVIPTKNISKLLVLGLAYLVVFISMQASSFVQALIFTKTTQKIIMKIRIIIMKFSLKNYSPASRRIEVGDAINRLTEDLPEAASFLTTIVVEAAERVVTLFFALGVLLAIDKRLALIIISGIPILIAINEIFLGPYKKHSANVKGTHSDLADVISEVWQYREQVFYYRAFDFCLKKLKEIQDKVFRSSLSMFYFQNLVNFVHGFTNLIPPFLVLFLGAIWVIDGSLTIGAIVAAMSYIGRVYGPIRGIADFRTRYQSYRVCVKRLDALSGELAEEELLVAKDDICSNSSSKANFGSVIEVQDVYFSYQSSERITPVFSGLSLKLKGPGLYRIKGDNGTGKSTLIAMLLGAIVPDKGYVRIDGLEASLYSDKEIMKRFSIVPQFDAIFTASILENCLLDYSEDDSLIKNGINSTGLYSGILRKEESSLIVSSSSLSGGQRKKIAIIRASIHNTPILILDEPFAPLDMKARMAVAKWIINKSQTTLVLLIDHSEYLNNMEAVVCHDIFLK